MSKPRQPLSLVMSGPPHPNLPYRYGCACGATWNATAPLDGTTRPLCGSSCTPKLFRLDGKERRA